MASSSRPPQDIPLPRSTIGGAALSRNAKGKGKRKAKSQVASDEQTSAMQSHSDDGMAAPWRWISLMDSATSNHPPIFTRDGSYFFSIVGFYVKIYSSATGNVVSTLSALHPHRDDPQLAQDLPDSDIITSACLCPQNAFRLITGSLNGCIMVWDFLDAILLQVFDLAQPITHLCAHRQFKDCVFVGVTRSKSKTKPTVKNSDDFAIALRVSLKPTAASTSSRVQKSSEVVVVGQTKPLTGLSISASGAWLVATASHTAYVALTSTVKSGFTKYVSPERLTCLTCHPLDDYFATGDDKGIVRLWYCLNERIVVKAAGIEKKAQTTTLHWHAHAVSSIAFTSNGAYLLSGGEESVLVIWQLHTGKKEFVPRIGAPIKAIAISHSTTGEEEYLLGLVDGTHTVVNAGNLKITRSFSHIKLGPQNFMSPSPSIPLGVHSLSSTFILPSSHPSSLQTYCPSSSKSVAELEVSPSNRVSRRDEKPLEPSRVENVVVCPSGDWMATVDGRYGDEHFRGEVYLKIWLWDRNAGFWTLNTRIDRPHGLMKVTAVAFGPTKDRHYSQLVTSGSDGNVKLWRIRRTKKKNGELEEFWVFRSSFNVRSEIPSHVEWSPDGSLLAVSLGPYLALYDPHTNIQRHLRISPGYSRICSAHFVGQGGRYLALVGANEVVLWDIVTQTDRWNYRNKRSIAYVVSHPRDESLAIIHRPIHDRQLRQPQTRIALLNASSPIPHNFFHLPFDLLNFAWYWPPSSDVSSFSFVGITTTWSVILFGNNVDMPLDESLTAREIVGSVRQRRTLFQDIFGQSAFTTASGLSISTPVADIPRSQTGLKVANIFEGPAYLLPPMESLFTPLVNTFLKHRLEEDKGTYEVALGVEVGSDDDVAMDPGEAYKPIMAGPQKRTVNRQEMDYLIGVFNMNTVKSASLSEPGSTVTKVNGIPNVKVNGHSSRTPPIVSKANGLKPHRKSVPGQAAPTPPLPSPESVSNLLKRKKSLG